MPSPNYVLSEEFLKRLERVERLLREIKEPKWKPPTEVIAGLAVIDTVQSRNEQLGTVGRLEGRYILEKGIVFAPNIQKNLFKLTTTAPLRVQVLPLGIFNPTLSRGEVAGFLVVNSTGEVEIDPSVEMKENFQIFLAGITWSLI